MTLHFFPLCPLRSWRSCSTGMELEQALDELEVASVGFQLLPIAARVEDLLIGAEEASLISLPAGFVKALRTSPRLFDSPSQHRHIVEMAGAQLDRAIALLLPLARLPLLAPERLTGYTTWKTCIRTLLSLMCFGMSFSACMRVLLDQDFHTSREFPAFCRTSAKQTSHFNEAPASLSEAAGAFTRARRRMACSSCDITLVFLPTPALLTPAFLQSCSIWRLSKKGTSPSKGAQAKVHSSATDSQRPGQQYTATSKGLAQFKSGRRSCR